MATRKGNPQKRLTLPTNEHRHSPQPVPGTVNCLGATIPTEPFVRIVSADVEAPAHGMGALRVQSGWQCELFEFGVAVTCASRLTSDEVFLEIRFSDNQLCFEAGRVVDEQSAADNRWRYRIRIEQRRKIVERYEFD